MGRASQFAAINPLTLLGLPVAVTALQWNTSLHPMTETGVFLSFLLLLLPWGSYLSWRRQKGQGLPVFPMIGFMYWVYFAIASFWSDRLTTVGPLRFIDKDSVTAVLWLAVAGVVSLWVGMKVRVPMLSASRQPRLLDRPRTWAYVRFVLVAGTLASVIPGSTGLLGSGGRQIIEISIQTVPAVALMMLLRRYLEGRASLADRLLLLGYFPARVLAGLASGWLGSVIGLGLICAAMYIFVRKKVPWPIVAISVATILFFQVGKHAFRDMYWREGASGGIVEKAEYWVNTSERKWSEALTSGGTASIASLADDSLQRVSLLTQVANVLDRTPAQVPFQEGSTYSYMAVTFIPRFLWPGKPSVNDANRYYQVAFGLTDPRDLNSVSIAVGCLAEAYINFGWTGVFSIMFLIGIVLGIYERAFVAEDSSELFLAIGLALLPGFLEVEAQMAQYIAGVVQNVLLTLIVFLPVIQRQSAGASHGAVSGFGVAAAGLTVQPRS